MCYFVSGGLNTDVEQSLKSIIVSIGIAITGAALPLGISILFLVPGLNYSLLQGLAAGASMCSGTTFSILSGANADCGWKVNLIKMRVRIILLSAAIIDDVVGLIMATIIPEVINAQHVDWVLIIQPILAAVAMSTIYVEMGG